MSLPPVCLILSFLIGTVSLEQNRTDELAASTEEKGSKRIADDNGRGAALKNRCEALLGERKAMQASLEEVV